MICLKQRLASGYNGTILIVSFWLGEDINHLGCHRFYNDALTVSFTKILTDDAVSSWKNNIQQCVRSNCEKLVKLCAMKLDDARFLHLLSMAFNPNNK